VTVDEFMATLRGDTPPSTLSSALLALWHDARGDWDTAHQVAQAIHDETGSWIHAYLHRKEGDLANAGYWYRRARQAPATGSLDDEWREIVTALIAET
jgi:hypothetical protein